MELKIRRQKLDFNIEHWKKVKFGKKKVSHYKEDILEIIAKECDQQLPEDIKMIEAENFIGVSKARRIQIQGEISNEICLISTDSNSRKWISIAIEGSLQDIQNFLYSKSYELNLILEALNQALEIVRCDINVATVKSKVFLPVVGGYPTWVRIAANSELCPKNEIQEMLGVVDSLLSSLSFKASFDISNKNDYVVIPSVAVRAVEEERRKKKKKCCFELC